MLHHILSPVLPQRRGAFGADRATAPLYGRLFASLVATAAVLAVWAALGASPASAYFQLEGGNYRWYDASGNVTSRLLTPAQYQQVLQTVGGTAIDLGATGQSVGSLYDPAVAERVNRVLQEGQRLNTSSGSNARGVFQRLRELATRAKTVPSLASIGRVTLLGVGATAVIHFGSKALHAHLSGRDNYPNSQYATWRTVDAAPFVNAPDGNSYPREALFFFWGEKCNIAMTDCYWTTQRCWSCNQAYQPPPFPKPFKTWRPPDSGWEQWYLDWRDFLTTYMGDAATAPAVTGPRYGPVTVPAPGPVTRAQLDQAAEQAAQDRELSSAIEFIVHHGDQFPDFDVDPSLPQIPEPALAPGEDADDYESRLEGAGLTDPNIKYKVLSNPDFDPNFAEGAVVRVSPPPGTYVQPGQEITVTVNRTALRPNDGSCRNSSPTLTGPSADPFEELEPFSAENPATGATDPVWLRYGAEGWGYQKIRSKHGWTRTYENSTQSLDTKHTSLALADPAPHLDQPGSYQFYYFYLKDRLPCTRRVIARFDIKEHETQVRGIINSFAHPGWFRYVDQTPDFNPEP